MAMRSSYSHVSALRAPAMAVGTTAITVAAAVAAVPLVQIIWKFWSSDGVNSAELKNVAPQREEGADSSGPTRSDGAAAQTSTDHNHGRNSGSKGSLAKGEGGVAGSSDGAVQHAEIGTCAYCYGPASYQCAGCNRALYCGAGHMELHWSTHMRYCRGKQKLSASNAATSGIALGSQPPEVRFLGAAPASESLGSPSTCDICCEERPQASFLTPTSLCNHPPTACIECVRTLIEVTVRETPHVGDILLCLTSGCNQRFQAGDVERFFPLGSAVLEAYHTRLLNSVLERMEGYRWCPMPNCGGGQLVADLAKSSFWTCSACNTRICPTHNVEFHTGITCAQFDANVSADNAWIKGHTKPCPACRSPIEKWSGCDHMTCKCGHQFCYVCSAPYDKIRKDGNHYHSKGCLYYASYGRPRDHQLLNYVFKAAMVTWVVSVIAFCWDRTRGRVAGPQK